MISTVGYGAYVTWISPAEAGKKSDQDRKFFNRGHRGHGMSDAPTAIDLFCGGGGFSEGMRQAGFEITHAIDIEPKACESYRHNHPETEVIQADILEFDPNEFPDDVDVVFGSPPCTEFSWAKQGGGGDIEEGMKLVKRFIHFVGELEPDYWVMENIPRLDNYLPETIDFTDIPWSDRTDSIDIEKAILDGDDYGTPQRRSRLFSGEFPVPEPTNEDVPSFGAISEAFPPSTDGIPESGTVTDPTYGIELPAAELTDHYYISHVTNREAEEIRVRKEDHSFYGKMSFPDDPEVPSRTVLATNRRVARETLVMEDDKAPEGLSRFRKPTIREIATIQGFPITYQFTGTSQAQKWRRVGDAVPPTMAFRVACSLLDALGESAPEEPDIRTSTPKPDTNLNDRDLSYKGRRSLSISRNFRHHVPHDNKQSFRVDLQTDKDAAPPHPLDGVVNADITHPVEFEVELYRGYSTDVVSTTIDLEETLAYIDRLREQHPERESDIEAIAEQILERLGPMTPDATTLQGIRSRRAERDEPLEYELLRTISDYDDSGIVDAVIPRDQMEELEPLECPDLFDGTELPVRVLFKLLCANYLSTKLNRCGTWVRDGPEDVFLSEEIREAIDTESIDWQGATCQGVCVDNQLRERYLESSIPEAPASTD
ncbi:DNA cytosine methyltransferase [Haloarcula laminariae]|uniref:DNA cytosine methyltransferase n=1 Tax=Haloarcula laminariae TaxID=2961577 RepID=UPI0021C7B452|nr:DNA cytosine methyltransferase [Halomicroarcula laminariae]